MPILYKKNRQKSLNVCGNKTAIHCYLKLHSRRCVCVITTSIDSTIAAATIVRKADRKILSENGEIWKLIF